MVDGDNEVSIQESGRESKDLPLDLTREFLRYYDHFEMILHSRQLVAVVLTVVLLWVGAAVSVQAFNHVTHHAQHQSATHATALCSWLCAAGQGVEAATPHIESAPALLTWLLPLPVDDPAQQAITAFLSRGPPSRI